MYRFCEKKIKDWLKKGKDALLVSGARQVGKTYIIRKVLQEENLSYLEINFLERPDILQSLKKTDDINDFINRLRLYSSTPLVDKKSVIFFDEIQEFPEIVTKIKFLVDNSTFRYVLSGSLLGLELKTIRSVPVGYYEELKMYPMSFLEFCYAQNVSEDVFAHLLECFNKKRAVNSIIHNKILNLFSYYLLVGGMPRIVQTFLESGNLVKVDEEAKNIIYQYKADFSKYESDDKKLRLLAIYDNIPSQLNKQNLRFIFSYLNKELKFDRQENSFLWLKDAGVVYPCYIANEIKTPLLISKEKNTFKLFMNDIGLLMSTFPFSLRYEILKLSSGDIDVNLGALYENYVMQELVSNSLDPYYYKSKKIGEIDFIVEIDGGIYAIEVKSGKDYKTHKALDNLQKQKEYKINKYIVLSNENLSEENNILYLPIYMCGFIKNQTPENMILPKIQF